MIDADRVARLCYERFEQLPGTGKPEPGREWTLLAAVVKVQRGDSRSAAGMEVVSMGTGTKCIGQAAMSPRGDVLNDSHAEVIARRGCIRYLMEELQKAVGGRSSAVFRPSDERGRWRLQPGVSFVFFSSHTPCGDASIIPVTDGLHPGQAQPCDPVSPVGWTDAGRSLKRKAGEPAEGQNSKILLWEEQQTRGGGSENLHEAEHQAGTRTLSDPQTGTRTLSDPQTGTRTLSDPQTGTRTLSDPQTGTRTLSDPQTGTRTLSDQQTGTRTLSDPQTGTRTLSDPQTGTRTLSDPQTGTRTLSDPQTGTRTLSDPQTGTRTLSDPQTGTRTLSDQQTGTSTLSDQQTGTRTLSDPQTGTRTLSDPQTVGVEDRPQVPDVYRTGAKCVPGGPADPRLPGPRYHSTGLLRVKPGRGEPTLSLCCSDKLCRWGALGFQGALLSHYLQEALYFSALVVGRCPFSAEALRRAVIDRVAHVSELPSGFSLCPPVLLQSSLEFPFSQNRARLQHRPGQGRISPCGAAISWCQVTTQPLDVTANGFKHGVTRKNLNTPAARSRLCKLELFHSFLTLVRNTDHDSLPDSLRTAQLETYWDYKQASRSYQQAWLQLRRQAFPLWPRADRSLLLFQ